MSGRRSILDELRDSAPRLEDATLAAPHDGAATGVAARVESPLPGSPWPLPVNSGWSPDNGGALSGDSMEGVADHEATPSGGGDAFRGFAASETSVAMLDLVFAGGNRVALPYATLMRAEFEPSKGITLVFAAETIVIEGRRLGDLYRAVIQHRAREVTEGDVGQGFDADDGPMAAAVTAIRRISSDDAAESVSPTEVG